jgi:RimJ/RimL family protein N-acetyltransferase
MFQILRALPADSDTLKQIAIASKGYWNYSEELMTQWANSPIITPASITAAAVYKALVDTSTVGWYRLWTGDKTDILDDLWVIPAFIGKGIGRSLFQHAVAQARADGALYIELDSDPNSQPFYEHMGCINIGESLTPWDRYIPRMRYDLTRPDTILETARLILRVQQAGDVPALIDLWLDPQVMRYMGGPRDRARLQPEFERVTQHPYADPYDLWPVIEKSTGQLVGHCGLLQKEVEGANEIELVYLMAAAVWGKGYATEIGQALVRYAFIELGVNRLIALIEPDNQASERVAIKLGFHLEKEVVRPSGALRKVYLIENPAKSQPA